MTTDMSKNNTRTATGADIEEILVANTGVDPATFAGQQDQPLAQLGMDSLAALELESTVLDRFGVQLPDEPLVLSISELVSYINKNVSGGK